MPKAGNARYALLEKPMAREKDIPPPPIVSQIDNCCDDKSKLTFVLPWQPKNTTLEYDVTFHEDDPREGVRLIPDGDDVEISVLGQRLGRYYTDVEKYMRPFIHPIMGPFGHSVTRGYPVEPRPGEAEDHPHHKSIWVAHGDTNGTDNWHVGGIQKQKEVLTCESGPVYGVLETVNEWISVEGRKDCEDRRKWTFWALPNGARAIDLEIEFHATEGPVTFGDTKEGGIISVRVATIMDVPRTGRIENSEGGIDENETWGKRSAWCDYSGLDEGGNKVGIVVMNHPLSFRYPTWWHVRNYGLMGANPFGWSEFYKSAGEKRDGSHTIEKGETMWFGYRVYVHPGDAAGGQVEDAFHGYANPPEATIE